jgi:hypothetical protein
LRNAPLRKYTICTHIYRCNMRNNLKDLCSMYFWNNIFSKCISIYLTVLQIMWIAYLSINYRKVCLSVCNVCMSVNHISPVSPMDFKLDRFLAKGTSKCSVKFDVVWIRNAKDIGKYIGKRSTHWICGLKINILTKTLCQLNI